MSVVADFFFKLSNAIIVYWFLSLFNEQGGNQESVRCNYFKWCAEDDIDKRDSVIFSQNRKICSLENDSTQQTNNNHKMIYKHRNQKQTQTS